MGNQWADAYRTIREEEKAKTPRTTHIIASHAHHKALEQLEATLIAAEAWLKPALTAVPCQEEFQAFIAQLASAKEYLITGKTR